VVNDLPAICVGRLYEGAAAAAAEQLLQRSAHALKNEGDGEVGGGGERRGEEGRGGERRGEEGRGGERRGGGTTMPSWVALESTNSWKEAG
jgi:hypothetical protein